MKTQDIIDHLLQPGNERQAWEVARACKDVVGEWEDSGGWEFAGERYGESFTRSNIVDVVAEVNSRERGWSWEANDGINRGTEPTKQAAQAAADKALIAHGYRVVEEKP